MLSWRSWAAGKKKTGVAAESDERGEVFPGQGKAGAVAVSMEEDRGEEDFLLFFC